jgi:fibronectin type 3 domain-containing protein
VRLTWQTAGDASEYNVYRSTLPHLGYAKINPVPVRAMSYTDRAVEAGTTYYYVVTAVGPGGLESNLSREAASPAVASSFEQSVQGLENFQLIWGWR